MLALGTERSARASEASRPSAKGQKAQSSPPLISTNPDGGHVALGSAAILKAFCTTGGLPLVPVAAVRIGALRPSHWTVH